METMETNTVTRRPYRSRDLRGRQEETYKGMKRNNGMFIEAKLSAIQRPSPSPGKGEYGSQILYVALFPDLLLTTLANV